MKNSRRIALAVALSLPIFPLAVGAQQPGAKPDATAPAASASTSAAPASPPAATPAAEPTKESKEEASRRFKRGIELFGEGDYRAALIEFKRAYELAPNYNVLYNIGNVYFQLQDYANALSSFEKYLSDGGNAVDAKRRADVDKDIEKLRTRVARIEITTPGVTDAEIMIDDLPVGKTPFTKPFVVNPGRHRVSAVKEGRTAASKTIEVASFDSASIALDMPEIVAKPADTTPPPPLPTASAQPTTSTTAPPPPPPRSIPWAGWGVTGIAAVGAIVTGSLALSKNGDLAELRKPASGASKQDLEDAASTTATLALVSDVFTGAAVVSGIVTLYFTVRDPGPAGADAPKSGFIKNVNVGVSPTGVMLKGSF